MTTTTTPPGSAPTANRVPSGPLGPDAPGYTAPNPGEDVPRETILPAFFGRFGGQEVPDFLLPALDELEAAFVEAVADPAFRAELDELRATYLGRPTPVYECRNLPLGGGARILLKREDLVHGGAHKGNNTLGQALLARRMGKRRLIAETGAGQHGTATAMVAALLGMECTIYMGAHDVARQRPNVERMELLGASVVPVTQGTSGLKDAIDVALGQWCEQLDDTFYVLGSATGPHPFPTIVRYLQSVISAESRRQVVERAGRLPDAVVAAVGGGSNAIGAFAAYLEDADVALVGVEPAGRGLDTPFHGAPICAGRTGSCTGPAPTSCSPTTARSCPPTRSRPAWTTPRWAPSTHTWPTRAGRPTWGSRTRRRSRPSDFSAATRASSPPWSPPTPSPRP